MQGDGENDIPLFETAALGVKGIMVGNACEGLRKYVSSEGFADIYSAQGQGAVGVLEGLNNLFRRSGDGQTHAGAANLMLLKDDR